MKLSALSISYFKGIEDGVKILIDDIVVLVGPNNCCKSTVLDAYEAYASMGAPLSVDYFHKRTAQTPIEIVGVFTQITAQDLVTLGAEWLIEADAEYGRCAKFKYRWEEPGEKGQKYSFSAKDTAWVKGGAGGWDTLLKSRLPVPIRINPNDDPQALTKVLKDLIVRAAQQKVKQGGSRIAEIMRQIKGLADDVGAEIEEEVLTLNSQIQDQVQHLFNRASVEFEVGVGRFKVDDLIKDGSRVMIGERGLSIPLEQQGSGMQRAVLWSAISALCDQGLYKKGRSAVGRAVPKILLLDEPEINLHPAVIKAARKAIYGLARVEGWQVVCTTHSPVFLDLTQDHTTLIKVSSRRDGVHYFQTDKAQFTDDEKQNMKMLNRCCPTVNEFFFYEKSLLVEGDTEALVYQSLVQREGLEGQYCVVNCRGKAMIPMFIKIFDQFAAPAVAIHDLDAPLNKVGKTNAMWTMNYRIREAADATDGRVQTLVHDPGFEVYYLGEVQSSDKPYAMLQHLRSDGFEDEERYGELRQSLGRIEDGTHPGLYWSVQLFRDMETHPGPDLDPELLDVLS